MADDTMMGETSREGARRMCLLQTAPLSCGPSPYSFIDPITSSLAYLAPTSSQYRGHLMTTLATGQPPRHLPTASNVTPGREIAISPDGAWVTVFHPNPNQSGGILAIYNSSILSPATTSRNPVPLSTFSLAYAPLATHHNYSPRLHTASGRGPSRGPRPPTTYDSTHGPSVTIVCADGIYLFHPFRVLDTVALDTVGSVALNLGIDNSQMVWRMQMLKCPLHTRFRAVMGGTMAEDTGLRAKRAWVGAVAGSEAVWVGFEAGDEVRVVRVEYEQDQSGRFSMTTVPLPSLPQRPIPSLGDDGNAESDTPSTEMRGLIFVSLARPAMKQEEETEEIDRPVEHSYSDERVAAVQIFQDRSRQGDVHRTRLEACQIENREFELAEGFKELGNDHSDGTTTGDWLTRQITLSRLPSTSLSPDGYNLLAIYPLPALEPPSLAVALLQTAGGMIMSYIDMADTSPTSPDSPWAALRGSSIHIREDIGVTDLSLTLSQGAERGALGLVSISSREMGTVLTVAPRLSLAQDEGDVISDTASTTGDAAASITLAIEQGHAWTDVIRAAFASEPETRRTASGEETMKQTYQRLSENPLVDDLTHLFSLQVAVFGSLNDPRHTTASELVRLLDACYLFTRCVSKGPGKTITFDLASVWPLITVADWVGGVLAGMMRSVITARGHLEWYGGELPVEAMTSRLLYLAHPTLRALVIRLHSQIDALVHFVMSLAVPIPHASDPLSINGSRDPRATILAKANIADVLGKEGVDLVHWGRAIESLSTAPASSLDMTEALLTLSCDPIKSSIPDILQALPMPSALLRSQSRFSDYQHDAITFALLADDVKGLAKCDRCGWKTGVLGDQGWIGLGPWGNWRKEQERQCICGGTWVRDLSRMGS